MENLNNVKVDKRKSRPRTIPTCHPNSPHVAHGLCSKCYARAKSTEQTRRRNATPAAKARKQRWYQKKREAKPNFVSLTHRTRRYGITEAQYNLQLEIQNNKCRVCLQNFGSQGPYIDHNHETGQVRALLCSRCNAGLGMLRESEFIAARMIAYLTHTGSITWEDWANTHFTDFPKYRRDAIR